MPALTRRSALTLALAAPAVAALPTAALAAKDEVFSTFLGGAIRGYDPVAYFTEGSPVKGSGDHQSEFNGATWSFATAENKARFDADPQAFAPQYGGYCAYAVAQGYTASIDPEAWRIVDGKLYLNYSKSVQTRWEQDIPGFISKADTNWPEVLN
ncbi:MAG: YHS domain-containing (seleno)protein [Pseudomonadota bacterium]